MSNNDALYIGGNWIKGYGKVFTAHNPASGESVWSGPAASVSDVERAIKAARTALDSWAETSLDERIGYLKAFQNELKQNRDFLAEIISKESGKPYWESLTEVTSVISKVDISIDAYKQRCPIISKEQPQGLLTTRHKPHGVVAVLGPFNFPAHLPHGHIIPSLIAGNTVVFKPSELTPGVGAAFAKMWEKAKFPPGIVNLIQGGRDVGKALYSHSQIDGLFFTGSFGAGLALTEYFAKHPGKIIALELGGNNPLIVGSLKDIPSAVYATILSSYLTAGQRCTCARRLIVIDGNESNHFIEQLIHSIRKIKVGTYTDKPEPFMGPVINEASVVRLVSKQASLQSHGATPLVTLNQIKENTGLVTPGLIDVTNVKELPDEETFGPLLQLIRVPDLATAINQANATSFGLSAGILSSSKEEYDLFYKKIRAGIVNWNTPLTGASSSAPFGGIKNSGNYRPSAYYAADYCSYPVASMETPETLIPENRLPGLD
jgi:succinylglutamic semialdehyde dehydrogenase